MAATADRVTLEALGEQLGALSALVIQGFSDMQLQLDAVHRRLEHVAPPPAHPAPLLTAVKPSH